VARALQRWQRGGFSNGANIGESFMKFVSTGRFFASNNAVYDTGLAAY
jgi:hypothetical protein